MKTSDRRPAQAETPEQILAAAEQWFRGQMELSRQCLGTLWGEHRDWVAGYLRQEVRQRLIARGWRPRNG